ncbi:MAG: methyltransferase domain-containing protein [Streptococcaceae bacterium]|nr:methyltransferase domain-containing protein [Streptococcaceae bacterium]
MLKPIDYAHALLEEIIEKGDTVIDATMGNGNDTAFLAKLTHQVYAFDIQEQAIQSTKKRLYQLGLQAQLILDGHENVDQYVNQPIKAAIFNLGYLPQSDKSIITQSETTIQSLEKIMKQLVLGGRIALVVYYGHEGGQDEKESLLKWAENLEQTQWSIYVYRPVNQIHQPPFVLTIEKL